MKKKILIGLILLAVLAFGVYKYMYKSHRDISSEEANYSVTVSSLNEEFKQSDSVTLVKYRDKTINLKGKITSIDVINKSIVIDEKMNAIFMDSIPKNILLNQNINVKGRFIDYDDLLEEFKMDQVTIAK